MPSDTDSTIRQIAAQSGSLPIDRREPPPQGRLPSSWLGREFALDQRRRAGASIGMRAGHDALHLSYSFSRGGGESVDVAETVRRANKIRKRLGGVPENEGSFPAKPKGMWRRTYDRLFEKAFEAEMSADEVFALRAEHMLARVGSRRNRPG
jgi:hypothetical protein